MNPWRIVNWTDADYRIVKTVHCHESELEEVLNLPFPAKAVCRDPVMELTQFAMVHHWYKLRWRPTKDDPYAASLSPYAVGDVFEEDINQALRECVVLAVDEKTGQYLYIYDMPKGRSFLRVNGKPISMNQLGKKWTRLLAENGWKIEGWAYGIRLATCETPMVQA